MTHNRNPLSPSLFPVIQLKAQRQRLLPDSMYIYKYIAYNKWNITKSIM